MWHPLCCGEPVKPSIPAASGADDPWGLARTEETPPRPVGVRAAPVVAPAVEPAVAPVVAPPFAPAVALAVIRTPAAAAAQRTWWVAVATALVMVSLAAFAVGRESWRADTLGDAAFGMLVLSSHPSGAHVAVDGRPEGVTPLALRVATGAHAVVITHAAGASEQFTADVTAGGSASRHVAFASATPVATSGALAVDARGAGGDVWIDGVRAGTAPLTVPNLSPGPHVVQLRRALGTVERRSAVVAGAVTSLVFEAPPAASVTGWIAVSLPFDVDVYEGATYVGSSRGERILVDAGRHTFDLVNEALLFRSQQTISVRPGQTAQLAVEVPGGALSVNAQPWANVTVDGRDLGETPLANISLPIGTHEVTLRHPTLGERREVATIRLGTPNRMSVDLRK